MWRDEDFENKVREAALDLQLQAEEASPTAQNNFVLKVVQLKEIFDVRHSVFIVGNAGTGSWDSLSSKLSSRSLSGKSQIWKTLYKTYQNLKRRPHAIDRQLTNLIDYLKISCSISVDPKAVSNDELFGYMHRQTREWKDGLFSTIMRDLANMTSDCNIFIDKRKKR